MALVIRFLMQNFTLTFLAAGLIAAALSLWRRSRPLTPALIVKDVFDYFILFAIGGAYFYNFVSHVFFGDMAARFIGWEQSPFQAEVGFASLGFAAVGFMAFRRSLEARAAAVIGPACFMLGAALGHIYQIIAAHNFAPGNAGLMLYTDIGLPAIGLTLLWLQHRLGQGEAPAGTLIDGHHGAVEHGKIIAMH